MTGAQLGPRSIHLGLHFFRGERWLIQRIELSEGFAQALGRSAFANLERTEPPAGGEPLVC